MIEMNLILGLYLAAFFVVFGVESLIMVLNVKQLRKFKGIVPESFSDVIDIKRLDEMDSYTIDNTRFSIVSGVFSKTLFLVIILSGLLPWWLDKLSSLGFVAGGLLFFAGPAVITSILGLPFDYYHSFVLEKKYGFNTKCLKTWITDIIKGTVLSAILGGILFSALLFLLKLAGESWWIYTWAVFFGFQLLIVVLYPLVIAPLFNKFEPLEEGELKEGIDRIARVFDVDVKGIFVMDASRRTRHTNAYLTGLGKAKRIVLYDSLISAHENDEIIAVLAHEIGHLKKGHIRKQVGMMALVSFGLLFLAAKLLLGQDMYAAFGFTSFPGYVGLFLAGVLWEPISFFLSPIGASISRKFEREADSFSLMATKDPQPMINALKRLAKDNLANLYPHPLNVAFNYSHPPLLERVEYLNNNNLNKNKQ